MGLKEVTNTIKTRVEATLSKAQDGRAWLARVAYPRYQNAQVERWQTQNTSQGAKWPDNKGWYKNWKLIGFGGGPKYKKGPPGRWARAGTYPTYPGRGRFVMIATAKLVSSVIGQSSSGDFVNNSEGLSAHRRIIGPQSLEVFTTVDYAEKVAVDRPFMSFSDKFVDELRANYQNWMFGDER